MPPKESSIDKQTINKNGPLLTFNQLSSKKVEPETRREYLRKVSQVFTPDEMAKKWNTSKSVLQKFYINNNLSIFEGNNLLEKEINALLNSNAVTWKGIRKRLLKLFSFYSHSSIKEEYKMTDNDLENYCQLFGISKKDTSEVGFSKIPNNYSIIKPEDGVKIKEEEEKMTIEMKTIVDNSGLVEKTEFVESNNQNLNKSNITELKAHKNPISIITFLNLSERERRAKLNILDEIFKLKSEEIEKILGIPSTVYFRKIKTRHMIFDFHKHEKLKEILRRCKTFYDCQLLVTDIIKNNRYQEFNIGSEKNFKILADTYFDVRAKKDGTFEMDNWTTFCNKITQQAIYTYKNNSRVTNLTESEVLAFEKYNRKTVSDSNLIRITRTVIKALHDEHQSWISIFDFKTAIENEGFELDSNERLIKVVDSLIVKRSFKNDYFTLKKIELDNPILSDDSSVRWEFVDTKPKIELKPVTPLKKGEEKPVKDEVVATKEETTEISSEPIAVETPVVEKEITQKTTNVSNNHPNNFINSSIISLSFNENNIDDVLEFIRYNLGMFGSGNVTINVSKAN